MGNVESSEDLKKFVTHESGLWLGLPGLVESMDFIARKWANSGENSVTLEKLLMEAKNARDGMTDKKMKESSDFYIKMFEKMLEKGSKNFVTAEIQRIEKLGVGKVSDSKKAQLRDRLNVLHSLESLLKSAKVSEKHNEL